LWVNSGSSFSDDFAGRGRGRAGRSEIGARGALCTAGRTRDGSTEMEGTAAHSSLFPGRCPEAGEAKGDFEGTSFDGEAFRRRAASAGGRPGDQRECLSCVPPTRHLPSGVWEFQAGRRFCDRKKSRTEEGTSGIGDDWTASSGKSVPWPAFAPASIRPGTVGTGDPVEFWARNFRDHRATPLRLSAILVAGLRGGSK